MSQQTVKKERQKKKHVELWHLEQQQKFGTVLYKSFAQAWTVILVALSIDFLGLLG